MRIIGIIMIVCSIGILSFYGYRKISRELYLRKLLNDNINFEIPRLNIKVPVLRVRVQNSFKSQQDTLRILAHSVKAIFASAVITARYMQKSSKENP